MAVSGRARKKRVFTRNRLKLRYATRLFPRVRLAVGELIDPARAAPEALHAAVLELRGSWK